MYGLLLQVSAFLFLILLSIIYFYKKRVDNIETKLYTALIIINIIGVLVDIVSTSLAIFDSDNIFLNFVSKVYLIYLISASFTYTYYTLCISYVDKNFSANKSLKRFVIITSVFCLVSFALPLYNYSDGNIVYTYGYAADFTKVIGMMTYVVMIFCIIKNFKNIKLKKYMPLIAFVILGVTSAGLQILFPQLLILTYTIVYVTFAMYFTIENPDVKMIEQLNIAKATAEKANRAKSDFLSSMSHEIRTPLNAIVGFSEMIENENTIEGCKENAKDIVLASHTLLDIVNGILDISKIEANKMEIVNKEYSLLPELNNLSKLLIPRIGEKPIELKTQFASDIPAIMYGDIGKIKQVITNILTNAAKYTEQGEINFTVNCINENDICSLVISVEDTGRGIKPEKIDTLFTKFNRLDEDKNTTIEGTGLGLAITKSLTEMMGGKIIVQSVYGKGSKFTIYLRQKIVAKEGNIETKEEVVEDIKFTGFKVLVVDDNNLNLKVADKLLKKYDLTTKLIESGEDCINLIKIGETYDLILMDDMMPKLRGPEVLAKLKEIPNFNIPVIALTANATAGIKESYLKEGFDDYLAKPIDKVELVNILKKYLKNKVEEKETNVADLKGTKVLVVDDNKLNVKIAKSVMKDYNFEIDEAYSGKECIEKVKTKDYDIVFMDYMMPEMDGIETLQHIKEIPSIKSAVVALTADATDGSREKFLKAGFDEYVSKPINREILDKVINKMLNKKQIEVVEGNSNNDIEVDKTDYLKQNGIDVEHGLELLGDMEMYNETLNLFMEGLNERFNKIKTFKEQNNMPDYAVEVHALKSDSKYLGFTKLAELAYNHEMKSKENDINYVNDNFNDLVNETLRIFNIVKKYFD